MTDFDTIVVGAGSAGAVVAARLSEDAHRRVLLLEAGPDHRSAQTPPAIAGTNWYAAVAEEGRTYPDLVAVHREGQPPMPYVRGRGVGGSSAVNGQIAMRGTPEDFDHWADDLGCTGWSWEEFRPWALKIEDDTRFGGDDRHGKSGPIPLSPVPVAQWSRMDRAVHRAASELGYPWCEDYHQPGAVGVGPLALTLRDGRRVSTNDAYLEPARDRPNLTIRGETLVDRVLFDGRRATGVRLADGTEIAAPHVVVAAGAIHSPTLLLRSGVTDRPVGENLVDHPWLVLVLPLKEEHRAHFDSVRDAATIVRYSSGLAGAGPADMQIITGAPIGPQPVPADAPLIAAVAVAVTKVFSRGRLRLAGDTPEVHPRIELDMLTDERDRVRMRDGFRRAVQLAQHAALGELTHGVTAMGTPVSELADPDAFEAWMDASVGNYYHPVGTCRMGRPEDPAAVVDTWGRLIGYDGVHVVDASILPDVPRANTNLTVIAVAERLADHLRRP